MYQYAFYNVRILYCYYGISTRRINQNFLFYTYSYLRTYVCEIKNITTVADFFDVNRAYLTVPYLTFKRKYIRTYIIFSQISAAQCT